MGLISRIWVNWKWDFKNERARSRGKRFRHQDRFPPGVTATTWLIQIGWLETMQRKDYWHIMLRPFGSKTFMPPRIIGLRYSKPEVGEKQTAASDALGRDYRQ